MQRTDPATYVRDGQLQFLLPDQDGKYVSPGDTAYRDKWLIVSLIGTWTVYSRDVASTLNGLRRSFPEDFAHIVAIAFEGGDVSQHLPNLRQFCAENAVEFPVLYGGSTDDLYKSLPDLSAVEAFPLTFVIDPQGQVVLAEEGIAPETSEKLRAATSRMSSAERDNQPSHGVRTRLMMHKPPPDGLPVVVNVIPNTPAAEAGFQVGDVIVQVDGKDTAGLELVDVVKLIRRDRVDAVTLTVAREGEPYVLAFQLIAKEVTRN